MISPKWITIFVVVILIFPFFIVKTQEFTNASTVTSNFNLANASPAGALVVPNDYPTIQAAIDNANAGDTVFVKKGTYNVANRLVIDKPLSLIGEDSQETILNGHSEYFGAFNNRNSIVIESSNVVISGFTITNGERAIELYSNVSNVKIMKNNIIKNGIGIFTDKLVTKFLVYGNNISYNGRAIGENLNNSVISGNIISGNGVALSLEESENVTISNNDIFNNSFGLHLENVSNIHVNANNITGNKKDYQSNSDEGFGIEFSIDCNDCVVYENNIEGNVAGVNLSNSQLGVLSSFGSGNIVYHNNFVNNSQNVNIEHGLSYNASGVVNGTTTVTWDNGAIGNYWNDYQSKYPNATEIDASGIGNMPYVIDKDNTDHYPLLQKVNISTEEPTASFQGIPRLTIAVIIVVVIATVIALLIYTIYKPKK